MRILGIDCGLDATGYGVIDVEGRRGRLIEAGVIRTSPARPLPERLSLIYRGLREIIERSHPERAAVESVFHSVNSQSALKLAHARGVSLLAAAESELATAEYSPLEIKLSVVGYGRAAKEQVQMMTASLLGLTEPVRPHDASDALAAALCDATLFASRALMRKRGA